MSRHWPSVCPSVYLLTFRVRSISPSSIERFLFTQCLNVHHTKTMCRIHISVLFSWLLGCFGFNSPLRQYFSLYRAVSQREGERGEKR